MARLNRRQKRATEKAERLAAKKSRGAVKKKPHLVLITRKPACGRTRKSAQVALSLGYRVSLIMGQTWAPADLRAALIRSDKYVDNCPHYQINLGAIHKFRDAVNSLRPDLVHSHEIDPTWALYQRWDEKSIRAKFDNLRAHEAQVDTIPTDWPVIYESHEVEWDRPRGWDLAEHDEIRYKEERVVAHSQAQVVVGNLIAAAFARRYDCPRPTVIPNCIPSLPRPLRTLQVKKELQIPNSAVNVMFCGYLGDDRGLIDLALAMPRIRDTHRQFDFRLHHVGRSHGADNVTGMLGTIGRCRFLGEFAYPFDAVRQLFAGQNRDPHYLLDVLSIGHVGFCGAESRYETWRLAMPNKLYEYAAAGVPIVASRQMAEVATEILHYRMGMLYDEHNIGSLAYALAEVGRNSAEYRDGVAEFAAENSYEKRVAEPLADLYAQFL